MVLLAIVGGAVLGGLVLLVGWSCLVMAARADENMERLMAAPGSGAPKNPGGE